MSKTIDKNLAYLGWSLWGELGIPSVVRNHAQLAIDPEPLIAFSTTLFTSDARLQEQVSRWCSVHADRVSLSRLQGLQKTVNTTLYTNNPLAKPLQLPISRLSLVRFRLRALCGVGARADVLAELLAHRGKWLFAADMGHLGYAKRSLARILAEFADAGLARTRAERNSISYLLVGAERWEELLKAKSVAWPDWKRVFELAALAHQLGGQHQKSAPVRRVEAVKAAKQIDTLGAVLGLPPVPHMVGNPDAWDVVVAWLDAQTQALADGTSSAFRSAS